MSLTLLSVEKSSPITIKLLSATAGNLENDTDRLNKIEQLLSGQLNNNSNNTFL